MLVLFQAMFSVVVFPHLKSLNTKKTTIYYGVGNLGLGWGRNKNVFVF